MGDWFGDITHNISDLFGMGTPPAGPNYKWEAQQQADANKQNVAAQTQQNRPNQTNAFGASNSWDIGPDGRPIQRQSFGSGALGQAAGGIMGQLGSAYSNPFRFNGPGIMSGDAARDQAITGAYNQATSRLDPQWQQRESQQQTQLLNQGLDPGSEAYKNAMGTLGQQRNDAYGSAMNSAIGQGTAAGNSIFQNSLAGHNTAYGEQVDQYNRPMGLAGALQGLTGQGSFNNAGQAAGPDLLGAAGMQGNDAWRNYQAQQQANARMMGAGTDAITSFLPFAF